MAAWKQWTVKAAVALGLALLLGLVQPAIMITGELSFNLLLVPMVIVLTVGSLYISSLCDSGLRAMVISAPVMLILVLGVVARPGPALLQGVGSYPDGRGPRRSQSSTIANAWVNRSST